MLLIGWFSPFPPLWSAGRKFCWKCPIPKRRKRFQKVESLHKREQARLGKTTQNVSLSVEGTEKKKRKKNARIVVGRKEGQREGAAKSADGAWESSSFFLSFCL